MGAFLLGAGAKGKRKALGNAEIMIHQPSGGTQGQVTDIQIQFERLMKIKKNMNKIMADFTGQTLKKISNDVERDYFMEASEAKEYGIIDEVLKGKQKK